MRVSSRSLKLIASVLSTVGIVSGVALVAPDAHASVKYCGKIWPMDASKVDCKYSVENTLLPLRQLTELREISLAAGKAKDLRPLVHLTKLEKLTLQSYDLPPGALKVLTRLKSLRTLNLAGTEIKSLDDVALLTQVRDLNLTNTGITDVSPLAGLPQLEALNLKGLKKLKGLKSLSKLTKLRALDLSGTEIKKLGFLKTLLALRDLTLPEEVSNLHILKDMTKLERLVVRRSGIKDITVLTAMKGLKTLILDFTPAVQDFTPLSELTALEWLEVNGGNVGNMKWMLPMKMLKILSLRNAQMLGAMPQIGSMKRLRFLSLASTTIANVAELGRLKRLELLDLSGTHVSQLKALNSCKKLRKIDLTGTNVERGEVARIKRVHPKLQVRYDLFLQ